MKIIGDHDIWVFPIFSGQQINIPWQNIGFPFFDYTETVGIQRNSIQ